MRLLSGAVDTYFPITIPGGIFQKDPALLMRIFMKNHPGILGFGGGIGVATAWKKC